MKILYIIHQFFPEFYSGTEKFVYNVSSMTSLAGHKVEVLSYSFSDNVEYADRLFDTLVKKTTYKRLSVVKIRNAGHDVEHHSLVTTTAGYKFARTFLYKHKPDIVHFGHTMRMFEFCYAANSLDVPFCLTLTDFFLLCPKVNLITSSGALCDGPCNGDNCRKLCPELDAEYIRSRLVLARDSILRKASKLFAPSKFVADVFKQEIPELDLEIIGHGLVLDRESRSGIHNNCINDTVTFLYAGTFNRYKGPHVITDAVHRARSNNIRLKIYGFGTDEEYFNELIGMIDRDDRCEYCGSFNSEQIREIMAQVDAVVVPSLCYETYSMIMHEAFQHGVPVIGSNLGGLAEKIAHGLNGYLVAPGDIDGLAKLIDEIALSPEKLQTLKNNIRKMIIPTVEQEALAYERHYLHMHHGSEITHNEHRQL